ncbi:MAG: outer rane adhesin-like protein [Candidatus Solibacter sp.]|nr:outer rane adhesin-like protein [Candidatus Solibacter sp.]
MFRHAALFLLTAASCSASTALLYNGSSGTSPAAQGWTLASLGAVYTESQSGGATVMTTTGSVRAGYGRLIPILLNSTTGYSFTLDLQLDSESHSSNDRAGFSLILIDSDLRGLELGFWTDHVWAQNDSPMFTHGEDAAYDTTQRTTYTLTVLGSGYTLSAGRTSLLSGSLRNYTSFGLPYTTPNFVFVGDDTFEANATARLFNVSVAPVPEPATWGLGAIALLVFRRCARRSNS